MNKLAKRISAVVLAGAMTLSSSIAAFAADLSVYIRTSESVTTVDGTTTGDITGWPVGTGTAFVIKDVNATDKVSKALISGTLSSGRLETTWNDVSYPKYLVNLVLYNSDDTVKFKGLQDGGYTKLEYDDDDNLIGGTWSGHSWMWAPASLRNVISYPDKTLDEVTCEDVNYGIVLSYEKSEYSWKN